jgi:hypothetical protein
MTTIEKYLKQFEAYFNGNLDQSKINAFEELIGNDNEIHAAWIEYCSVMEACADEEAISLRSKLEKAYHRQYVPNSRVHSLNKQWIKVAAVVVMVILVGSLLFFPITHNVNLSPQNAVILYSDSTLGNKTADTTQDFIYEKDNPLSLNGNTNIEAKPVELASIFDLEEYQISPVFAELLHNVYRSNWFRITSPKDSIMFGDGDSILFSWETNIRDSMYFDILDRNGNVIFKKSEAITSPWTFTPNLSPAIYMYRFSTKDQPIWVGVIVKYTNSL